MKLAVVIPALNEEATVGRVVSRLWASLPDEDSARIVVSDNGSSDKTAHRARSEGAEVVSVPVRGYGMACLAAIDYLGEWPDLLVFIDADGSSLPEEISRLVEPIRRRQADLVMGERRDTSHMTVPQKFGTRLAVLLVNFLWRASYHDMGPYRAIDRDAYRRLGMQDRTWGWTIEMQILAAERGLSTVEVPVSWAEREGGASKISGSVSGVLRAGSRILGTVAHYALTRRQR